MNAIAGWVCEALSKAFRNNVRAKRNDRNGLGHLTHGAEQLGLYRAYLDHPTIARATFRAVVEQYPAA